MNIFSAIKLVDRKNETEMLFHDIQTKEDYSSNKTIILWADSGVGKSSVVQILKSKPGLRRPIVVVETPPMNERELIGNGSFLSHIAMSFDDAFRGEQWSFEEYLHYGMSNRQLKKILEMC